MHIFPEKNEIFAELFPLFKEKLYICSQINVNVKLSDYVERYFKTTNCIASK